MSDPDEVQRTRSRSSAGRVLTTMGVASAVIGALLAGLVLPFVWVVQVGLLHTVDAVDRLPQRLAVDGPAERSVILDRDGQVVARLYKQNRESVPLAEISEHMQLAILAIEDYRFFDHGALDIKGTIRAIIVNQAAGGVVQGGSSITQQLVKLSLVNAAKGRADRTSVTEDTVGRKLRELRYAIALEKQHTKHWILEQYLNAAYFGAGAHGVEAAAERYFSTSASQLTITQAALLAGAVKNPTEYDPLNDPEQARYRRNVVLARMAELHMIPAKRSARLQKSTLGLRPSEAPNGCVRSEAPFFCDYVVEYLLEDETLGRTEAHRRRLLRTGGLVIRTSLDLAAQASADRAVQNHTDPTDQAIGAIAMVEPGTGEVRAVAQSRPMGNGPGETYINYVVPSRYGASAGFQAGSTFKAFVLAAALEQGIAPTTRFPSPDSATYDQSDYANCPGQPPFAGSFTVGNNAVQSETGSDDMYSGTRRSINTFYLRLEQETGVCEPYRLAQRMGVDLDASTGTESALAERVPLFVLGVANASPVEMAEAYATFAARGLHCASRPVNSVDRDGEVIAAYEPECEQVVSTTTADTVNDVLRGVMEPGGFGESQALDRPSAGKTGNNEGLSVWFLGYTPHLATAAMLAGANDAGSPQLLEGVTVGGRTVYDVAASVHAAPMWGDAMREVAPRLPYADFAPAPALPQESSTDPAVD